MSLKASISETLKILNKAISQIPLDKKPLMQFKLKKILMKYP